MSLPWPSFWQHIPDADRSALSDILTDLLAHGALLGDTGRDRELYLLAREYQRELAEYLAPLHLELLPEERDDFIRFHSVVREMPSRRAASLIRPPVSARASSISCNSASRRTRDSALRAGKIFSSRRTLAKTSATSMARPSLNATARSMRFLSSRVIMGSVESLRW